MYDQMAKIYDYFMSDVPYDEWMSFVEMFVEDTSTQSVLDLGCGTGEMSFRLAKASDQVVGIDQSTEMVQQALNKTSSNDSVDFIQADLVELTLGRRFNVIVSFLDVLNYVTDPADVKQAFKRVKNHLYPGGKFLFDVHSLEHMERLIKDEIYSEVTDEMSYIWFCFSGKEKGEVHYDLTFFVADEGNRYKRFDEEHTQRTFPIEQYKEWLVQAGFSRVRVYADFNFTEENDVGDRLFFVCES